MSNRTKGILCIIASAFCFALMSTFVRLSGDLPSVQKSFFRNFVAMFIALAVLLKEGGGLKLQKGCLPLHLLRIWSSPTPPCSIKCRPSLCSSFPISS